MLVQGTRSRFQGSYVALPTPFKKGEVDYASLERLIEWHIASGTDGLVLAGTTGEAATLTESERIGLLQCAVGVVRGTSIETPISGNPGSSSLYQLEVAFPLAARREPKTTYRKFATAFPKTHTERPFHCTRSS